MTAVAVADQAAAGLPGNLEELPVNEECQHIIPNNFTCNSSARVRTNIAARLLWWVSRALAVRRWAIRLLVVGVLSRVSR